MGSKLTLQNLRGRLIATMSPILPDFEWIRKSNMTLANKLNGVEGIVVTEEDLAGFEEVFSILQKYADARRCDVCDELNAELESFRHSSRNDKAQKKIVDDGRAATFVKIRTHMQTNVPAHTDHGVPDLWLLCPELSPLISQPVCLCVFIR